MAKSQRPHVAALIDTTTSWGRNLVRGINNYNRNHGVWYLWIQPRARNTPILLPPKWQGNGIIACIADGKTAADLKIKEREVAVVNVSAVDTKGINFPRVATDRLAAGLLAARYLLDRGFVNFAYYTLKNRPRIDQHYQAFSTAISNLRKKCDRHKVTSIFSAAEQTEWDVRQKQLLHWLQTLPKPVAIVAWNAELGREIVFACQQKEILVPEQVAVLVADDDLLCEACTPSLSAMRLNSQQIGYEAAVVLDQLMHGKQPTNRSIPIAPISVATRQSTDTLAIDNVELAHAVAFIRNNSHKPIQVKDILHAVPISRRLLEQYFQKTLGRSPAQEIRFVHIERAKQLLAETDLQIPDVADGSGFGSPEYFARQFKTQVGVSPLKFRFTVRGH